MDDVSGIILAGGIARRMGQDKALLVLEGRTLLHRTVDILSQLTDDLVVVGRTTIDISHDVRVMQDEQPQRGPLGGLLTGLHHIARPYAVTVSCDLPFLQLDALRDLIALGPGFDAVVPYLDGRAQPLHAVYARCIESIASRQLDCGDYRMHHLLDQLKVRWVGGIEWQDRGLDRRSCLNVNTAADWECARQRLEGLPQTISEQLPDGPGPGVP